MDRFVFIQTVSIIMIVGGLLLQLVKQNRVFGVRTAETLSNRAVWDATNKVVGRIAMMMGIPILVLNLWAHYHQWTLWFDTIAEILLLVSIVLLVTAMGVTILSAVHKNRLKERR